MLAIGTRDVPGTQGGWIAPLEPIPGTAGELLAFERGQRRLAPLCQRVFSDPGAAQTVVVVPSLSVDPLALARLEGAPHYEERLLCLLMLLRRPRTHVVYLTSQPLSRAVVDYYLALLPRESLASARSRLTLLSCDDASPMPLTQKILARPRLMERVRAAVPDPDSAHITCYCATALERTLAVQVGVPLYATDPALAHLGTKSGGREVFRRAGVPLPRGFEHLRDGQDVAQALAEMKREDPGLGRAVVKLNEGFAGDGNAVFHFDGAPGGADLAPWVEAALPSRLRFVAAGESWERFEMRLRDLGGVAESFVEGPGLRSPSVQCRIDPLGVPAVISTHDQVLGGDSGQVFTGCTFPADAAYRREIRELGMRVARVLGGEGVLGRFGIDFVSRRRGLEWEHAAIEINLRKGGTTHPFLMLQFLTDGACDPDSGLYRTPAGRPCHYYATDSLQDPAYRGLTPDALVDAVVAHHLHFDAADQRGVVFHLLGALPGHGKVGAVCIGDSAESALGCYRDTVAVLDREARRRVTRPGRGRTLTPGTAMKPKQPVDRSVAVLMESEGKVMAMAFPEPRMLRRWLRSHPGCRVADVVGRRARDGGVDAGRRG